MKKVVVSKIEAKDLRAMINTGQKRLESKTEYVNSLNVFPVPDGDTGTNMNLTFTSGKQAVKENTSEHAGELGAALAKGLLMGARGNSGVILSQLFRGFSQAIKEKETINANDLAAAFRAGVETAYKAVMKPVEGTILTVARESAKAGVRKAGETDDVIEVMTAVLNMAEKALEKTPDLLPVLKEVGVVDSGGQGLVYVYEGFLSALKGEAIEELDTEEADLSELVRAEHHRNAHEHIHTEDITYGYCTEIMVRLGEGETVDSAFDYDEFRNHLNEMGDSLLVVADEEVVKVHVHTEKPGEVMNYGQKFGSLIKIKVDNMREQHSSLVDADSQPVSAPVQTPTKMKDFGVIAVAAGKGLAKLFESMGVDYVIQGGQTMNPSTEDILKAIEEVHAKNILILPNNKNIFMAAEQAASVAEVPAEVIPSRNISQGLTAMLGFNPLNDLSTNKEDMIEELDHVISGQVTYAIRDTEIEGLAIKKGDYMGLIDGSIKVAEQDRQVAAVETVRQMLVEDSEILTIIYGEDGTLEEAEAIAEAAQEMNEDLEVEIHVGDQPVYPYIFSVE